jgi:hypothetical protein
MSKNALFPTLSALPFTTASCAPWSGEEQMPITSDNLPPSIGDTSRGPHGVKQREKPVEVSTPPRLGRWELY